MLLDEVSQLKRRLNIAEEEKNEAKRKIAVLESEKMERDTSISALTFKVRKLEEGRRELVARNVSMQCVKQQMKALPMLTKNKGMRAMAKLSEGVPDIYLGLVMDVEKKLDKICVKEVYEMQTFRDELYRNWNGRGVIVGSRGVISQGGKQYVLCRH
jgi:chromosome segregation ATPase